MFMIKLLALIPSFYGSTGDAVNERQWILALSRKIERVYVITLVSFKQIFTKRRREIKELKDLSRNITTIPLPLPQVNPLITYLGMIGISCFMSIIGLILCWLRKIDLIYIRNSFLSMGFLSFQPLAKRSIVKIPAIIEDELSNDIISKFCIVRMAPIMDRLVLAKAAWLAVSSKSFYCELVKRRRLTNKRTLLEIPAGVNLELTRKIKNSLDHEPLRDTLTIGFIGSLSWWQGVDILIYAISLLKEKIPNFKLVIIGDGELRPLIEELCKTLDIHCRITGFLSHEEALRCLSMLDIMVLPRRRTATTESSIPIKVVEAWALGIPVIITKHRVFIKYGIKDFEDVIYCEPYPSSVANAILTLLNNPILMKKLKINGPKLAMRFDYDKIVQSLLRMIERTMKGYDG